MKVSLMLAAAVMLCASVVSSAGPLTVHTHVAVWLPSVSALGHLPSITAMPEPAELLFLGVGFVALARRMRPKSR